MTPATSESARARILAAATKEFSDKGLRGGRVDTIAASARANKQLIYYYFGSKSELFKEVLRQSIVDGQQPGWPAPTSTRRLLVQEHLYASEPDFIRLIMWEALEAVGDVQGIRPERLDEYVERIEEDQRDGYVPDIDPRLLLLAEFGLTATPFVFPQMVQAVLGKPITDPGIREQWQSFLASIGGLLDSSATPAPPTSEGGESGRRRRPSVPSPRRRSP